MNLDGEAAFGEMTESKTCGALYVPKILAS